MNVNIHWQFLKIVHWRRTSFRKPRGVRRKNPSHPHHSHQEYPGSVLVIFLQHEMCCQPLLLHCTLFMRKVYTNYDAGITSEHYLYILIGSGSNLSEFEFCCKIVYCLRPSGPVTSDLKIQDGIRLT